MPQDAPIDETLRLARDLCLGVAAFFVTPAGTVFSNFSDVMRPDDAEARVAALARSCLAHPSTRNRGLFWSAESTDESGGGSMPDSSLACVVAPVWSDSTWAGLLGVVDVWLPELDEEQRSGLVALARRLAERSAPSGEPVAAQRAAAGTSNEDVRTEPFIGEVLDNLPDGLVVTRVDGTIVLVNQTFAALTGLAMDAVLGEDVGEVLSPAGEPSADGGAEDDRKWLEAILGQPEPATALNVRAADHGPLRMDASGRRIESRFAGDCFVTLVHPARPFDDEGRALRQLAIHDLLEHIEVGIVCCDANGTVVLANRAARRLQGVGDDELQVGSPFPAQTGLRTPQGEPLSAGEHPLLRSSHEDIAVSTQLVLLDDTPTHVTISARPLRVDDGRGAIAVLRDVTADQERQEHLTHYALHDPLTGLANRYLLLDALGRMLDGLSRRGGYVSLIFLDLDYFKAINDEYGHETGDAVLRAVGRRLERAVRGEDVVARLGGDEFVVAHFTADRLSDGDAMVARIRKVLSPPYRFGDLVLDVGASVGWVSASSSVDTPESLISRADRAMYEHKHQRRAVEQEESQ